MTNLTRRATLSLALAAPALLITQRAALAAEPEIYAEAGIAIDGSDPVAYFAEQGPVPGGAATTDWKGATWRFATPENADAFKADPMKFAPQFGGYCAYAASLGYLAPTAPEAWTIHKGQLFLNASLRARELWLQDVDGNIAKARANWPGILG
ncbi:YHS domain-containing (seleno)protein [Mameliella sediminis]|uniref:YHS domain-containing (seleno)protein n=1 Tax=Mameliella sediminis TaxID=2836866 RepID=UPI001C46FC99|nr:YHS domain-containing (seleno)protein [Mameliella sediminis]MBV7394619.1 YHS domain protein [Mameliella sediminis]MBY6164009.1 YHS domain protein [Mameliella alba]MBY6172481.1 YHS domain protein [Mameliella alba]MBY6177495.1 YHS domain protein [Mameliella alba]